MVVAKKFLKASFRGFYRIQPRVSNVITILLETWYIAIASSALLTRISQFLLASIIFVGRTDLNFLHEDVNLFGAFNLQNYGILSPKGKATPLIMCPAFTSPIFSCTKLINTHSSNGLGRCVLSPFATNGLAAGLVLHGAIFLFARFGLLFVIGGSMRTIVRKSKVSRQKLVPTMRCSLMRLSRNKTNCIEG